MHGTSGSALFLLRLHEQTQDAKHLDQAVNALRLDLADSGWISGQCAPQDAPWRAPVLGGGAGIAMVLHDVLAHGSAPELGQALDALRKTVAQRFLAHSGLFTGRAGAMLAHHRLPTTAGTARARRRRGGGLRSGALAGAEGAPVATRGGVLTAQKAQSPRSGRHPPRMARSDGGGPRRAGTAGVPVLGWAWSRP